MISLRDPLLGERVVPDAVGPAGVGHVALVDYGGFVDNGGVDIGVADDRVVHVHNRGVVGKSVVPPLTAGKADAHVAATVVHTAVVADVHSPVAFVVTVAAAVPVPVGGRPQGALIGCR